MRRVAARRVSFTCVLNICEVAVHSMTAHEHGLRRRHLSAIHRLRVHDSGACSGCGGRVERRIAVI